MLWFLLLNVYIKRFYYNEKKKQNRRAQAGKVEFSYCLNAGLEELNLFAFNVAE